MFCSRALRHLSCCVLVWAPLALAPITALAAKGDDLPVLLQADQMANDDATQVVTATGHVEVARGDHVLRADKITYDKKTKIVRASGHIAILQPSGEVLFTDKAELTDDMRDGFIEKIKILFPDQSRLAAQNAERYQGRYLIAHYGVYSSCLLCADNPDAPPLWQLKGERVTHDAETKDVIYSNATIEFDGVPLFYTPYFSHPDPTVKKRDGFLMPIGGYSQYIGTFARTPYYFDLSPTDDATVAPTFSESDGVQMGGEWRHRSANGSMKWNVSFTNADLVNEYGTDKGDQLRGHLFGSTQYNFDNVWRAGTDIALTTDKSYLKRYAISSEDLLVNRGYLEGFKGRDYAVVNSYYFQDLRPGTQQAEPIVAPDASFALLGEPGQTLGGRWSFDGGLLITTRNKDVDASEQGPNTRRLALHTGWERQLVSSTGFLTTLSSDARVDTYMADNVLTTLDDDTTYFHKVNRTRPYASADITVRYPLGRRGDSYQQIVEPIGMFTVAPSMKAYNRLPNEDSLDVEFDETNIFSKNRFAGIDLIEGGTRAAYGVRQTLIGDNGARIEALVGQVYHATPNDTFPDGSGLNDHFSDYVGRVDFTPNKWFDANYGLRLNKDSGRIEMQDAQASVGAPVFRPFLNYMAVHQTNTSATVAGWVEEGTAGFNSTFEKYWTLTASHKQAFRPDPGPRTTSVGFSYGDECFQAGLTGSYDDTNRADLKTGTTVIFHFYLKNIGGFHTDSVTSAQFQTPSLAGATTP
jgi:LPS-assembly protein